MKRKQADGTYRYYVRYNRMWMETDKQFHDRYYHYNWQTAYYKHHVSRRSDKNGCFGTCCCKNAYLCEGDCCICAFACHSKEVSFDAYIEDGILFEDTSYSIWEQIDNLFILDTLRRMKKCFHKEQQLILRYLLLEYSESEIAQELGLHKSSVHRRIQVIKKILRNIL